MRVGTRWMVVLLTATSALAACQSAGSEPEPVPSAPVEAPTKEGSTEHGIPTASQLFADPSAPGVEPTGPCDNVRDVPATQPPLHIEDGEVANYPTFPPSSGPHDEDPLPSGVYDELLTLDPAGSGKLTLFRAVHSLEHGYVILFHEGLGAETLERIVDTWGHRRKVIVAPADGLEAPIVLVAWERIRLCHDLDEDAIERFVSAYVEGPTAPEPHAA